MEKKLLKRRITIEPPAAFDPAWANDGLVGKAPPRIGEKAWWLRQLMANVPISTWPDLLAVDQDELFSISLDPDWGGTLIAGWIDAACAAPSEALTADLLPFLAGIDPWPESSIGRTTAFATILDGTDDDQLVDKLIMKLSESEVIDLLVRLKLPMVGPGNTSHAIVRGALKRSPATLTRPQARMLALSIPQSSIQTELEALAGFTELTAAAEEFATTLEFRHGLFIESSDPS